MNIKLFATFMLPVIMLLIVNTLVMNVDSLLLQTDEVAQIRAIVTRIIQADNQKNLSGVLQLYDKDAALFPPGEAVVRGVEKIRPRYEKLFAEYDPALATRIVEIEVAGTWAYVQGENTGNLKNRTTGQEREVSDIYFMVLRKNKGAWQIARLIWHAAPQENR